MFHISTALNDHSSLSALPSLLLTSSPLPSAESENSLIITGICDSNLAMQYFLQSNSNNVTNHHTSNKNILALDRQKYMLETAVLCQPKDVHVDCLPQGHVQRGSFHLQRPIPTALKNNTVHSPLRIPTQKKESAVDASSIKVNTTEVVNPPISAVLLKNFLNDRHKSTTNANNPEKNLSPLLPDETTDINAAILLLSFLSRYPNINLHKYPNLTVPFGAVPMISLNNTQVVVNNKLKYKNDNIIPVSTEKNPINPSQLGNEFLNNSFPCTCCGRLYQSEKGLKCHMRVHDPATRGCPYCDKKFARKSYLLDHIRTHTGEKPYSCSFCRKRFACKRNLNQHIRTHSDEKRYCCPWCDCKFRVNQSLKVHLTKAHRYIIKQ